MKLQIKTPRVFLPLLKPSRYKGIYGGRGSGKSHFFAELCVEMCVSKKTDIVCVREVQKSLKHSVKKLIEQKIEALGVGHLFEVQETMIKCPHGGVIIFQGMQDHTADSIKSLQGFNVAWVEEAQSLSARSLELLRPTLRENNGELWFSWNPRYKDDPVETLLRSDSPPRDSIVVKANYSDNPWFPNVLLDEMMYDRQRDYEKYSHVWLGEYETNSNAKVFTNWSVQEFESNSNAHFKFGADWGFAVDPSVLIRCYIDGRKLYVDYEAYMVGCEIDMLPDLFRRVPESEKWFITADSSRPETISYMQRHGFPRINAAIKGARSIEEGIEFLKSFDIIVHPRCTETINELLKYSYEVDKDTGEVLPKLADRDNHVIDALRYACEGARRSRRDKEWSKPLKPQLGYVV
jgi:phage terminase large subunit